MWLATVSTGYLPLYAYVGDFCYVVVVVKDVGMHVDHDRGVLISSERILNEIFAIPEPTNI